MIKNKKLINNYLLFKMLITGLKKILKIILILKLVIFEIII